MSLPWTSGRRLGRTVTWWVLCLFLITLLVGCSGTSTDNGGTSTDTGQASAGTGKLDETSPPPWSLPADVSDRAAAAGLDLGPMGMAEHYHPQLQIVINGVPVPVPAGIGIDPSTGAMSSLHTHSSDGVLHIEADAAGEPFTLGQLFIEWGVKLTSTQIGGVHAKAGDKVTVTSNGKPVAGNPADLHLEPNQQIVLQLP
ncbi:MAG TPA: hypothetical protein VGP44_07270 [Gemmatimonadales bacterium]|nr:hypothetical protein [Gemmatimonadales bacterium]